MICMVFWTLLIFDIDGTLWDEEPFKQVASKGMDTQAVQTYTEKLLEEKGYYDWIEVFQHFERDYMKLLQNNKELIVPKPHVVETLNTLSENYEIAFATDGARKYTDYKLKQMGLYRIPSIVCTVDDVKTMKPDPYDLKYIMNKLDREPNETVVIGDGEKDMIAAERAGIQTRIYIGRVSETATVVLPDISYVKKYLENKY